MGVFMWQASPLTLIPLPPLGGEETLTEPALFLLEPSPPNGGVGQGERGRQPSRLMVAKNA
jgi:hypothetical protein